MTQLKDGGRQPSNREERPLSASTVIARGQGNGEPCKSRGLRTVLWAAGGEIPPADPAAASSRPEPVAISLESRGSRSQGDGAGAQQVRDQVSDGVRRRGRRVDDYRAARCGGAQGGDGLVGIVIAALGADDLQLGDDIVVVELAQGDPVVQLVDLALGKQRL